MKYGKDGLREIERRRKDMDIVIPSCDGSVTLTDPGNLFAIEDRVLKFLKKNCSRPGRATEKTPVGMHEEEHGVESLSKTFDSLRGIKERVSDPFRTDMDNLCLTEHQIVHFLNKYKEWIVANWSAVIYFLLRGKDQYLVVVAEKERGNNNIALFSCELEGNGFSCSGGYQWVIFPQ